MLSVGKSQEKFGIQLQGDFFDFDRLYFSIIRLTGNFGNNPWKPSEGYDEVCEYILALCYELRHAWQGDRGLIGTFNGLSRSWFESNNNVENDDDCDDDDDFDDDDDLDDDDDECTEVDDVSRKNDEKKKKFNSSMLKDITFQNAYFRTELSFAEALFYTFVLEDLIDQNVTRTIHAAAPTDPLPTGPQEEYEQLALSDAIAVVSLYNSNIWNTLYRFLGYGKLKSFIVQYGNAKREKGNRLFKYCDTEHIGRIIARYQEQTSEIDNPDLLCSAISQMIGINPHSETDGITAFNT